MTPLKNSDTELVPDDFSALIEAFPDAVVVCRGSGEIVLQNRAFTRLLGLPPEQVQGKRLHDYTVIPKGVYKSAAGEQVTINEAYLNRFHQSITTFFETGSLTDWEGYILNKDAIAVPVVFSLSYHPDRKGSPQSALVIIRDTTLVKKAQAEQIRARHAAEEANREKSEFLANMSHEIRTPMNGVLGMLSLLKKSGLDPKQQRWVEVAGTAAESLLLIINDILDFSKIEAGRFTLDQTPFDLHLTIKDIADLYKLKAAEKNLSFSYSIDEGVPEILTGDPARIRQILTNLIGNAIKFTDAGFVSIHIQQETVSADQVKLKMSVSDTGSGIPENLQGCLFERFSTCSDRRSAQSQSTGLGLVISKQLCELMGGDIGFRSTPGSGSTFWFTCVLKKPQQTEAADVVSQSVLKGKRILLIENIEDPESVMAVLQKQGCICAFAPDGHSAVSQLQKEASAGKPFHAVILDRQMHDMDISRFAEIVKGSSLFSGTHLLMATASGIRGDAQHLQKSGFSGYITHPLTEKNLVHALISLFKDGSFVTRHTAAEKAKQHTLVLIVEDNEINMEVVSGILDSLGYRYETAANGVKAVEAFRKNRYDIVLMDLRMPELDGYGAARHIRSHEMEKKLTPVPIVAMSADVTEASMQACFDAGMDGFIAKPISSQGLAEILEKYLFSPDSDDKKVFLSDTRHQSCYYDLQEVLERFNNNEGLLKKIIRGFIENFPREFEKLQQYVRQRRQDELRLQSHSLKGSFGNIGATQLKEIALALEHAGKASDFEQAETLLPQLQEAFETFMRFAETDIL